MAPINRAAWIKTKQSRPLVVDDAPYTAPGPNEVTIRTTAVAINPADCFIQAQGLDAFVSTYPAIIGCDAAGVVEEVGPGVTAFAPGDHVFGLAPPLPGGVYKQAAFQAYVVLAAPSVAKIPDGARDADAAVLPLGINTASACLFGANSLALTMPPSTAGTGKTLIVWGASSSVGACGVQLAAAAGYEVLAVASARNHAFCKSLGATAMFDQADAGIVADMTAALQGKDVVGAFSAVSADEAHTALVAILTQSGARVKRIASVNPGAGEHATAEVSITVSFAGSIDNTGVGEHIWGTFLPAALAAGRFQYAPPPRIVGHGLEALQGALDALSAGVSATKLVVTL